MAYIRMVKFDFCQIFKKKKNKREDYTLFDIELVIKQIIVQKLERTEIDVYDGCKVRIEKFEYDDKNSLWALRVLRLRDSNLSYVVKPSEEAKPIELGDDEYLGEDMTMLFDVVNNVAMIQRNRFALGFKNLQKLFQKIVNIQDLKIEIRAISKVLDYSKIKKDYYKSIEIRFANIHGKEIDSIGGALGTIIRTYNNFDGYGGSFCVNLGRSRKESLAKEPVKEFINSIAGNEDVLDAAILRAKDAEDNDIDIINLFANVFSVFIRFDIAERTSLSYEYCVRKMTEKYIENKELILSLI